jgi:hypothetical protein
MENENPKYLNCPWCPAQSFLTGWVDINQAKYECPAHHTFYIQKEDTSFNFGYNKEEECE